MKKQCSEELSILAKKFPGHFIVEKCLWVGNVRVEIDHIDDNLDNPLNLLKAFESMAKKEKSNSAKWG